jgi:hypothetical protein
MRVSPDGSHLLTNSMDNTLRCAAHSPPPPTHAPVRVPSELQRRSRKSSFNQILNERSSLSPGKRLHHQRSSSSHDASPHPQGERPAPVAGRRSSKTTRFTTSNIWGQRNRHFLDAAPANFPLRTRDNPVWTLVRRGLGGGSVRSESNVSYLEILIGLRA